MHIFALITLSLFAQASGMTDRLNKNGVALCEDRSSSEDSRCYDPVSYFTAQKAEVVGAENSKRFRVKYKDATYVFTSQEHLDLFNQAPEKYQPQFGGWCAYAVAAKSEKVDIDPKSFRVQNGRLLLFYNGVFSDTRKTWTNDKNKTPEAYLTQADAHWPATQKTEP